MPLISTKFVFLPCLPTLLGVHLPANLSQIAHDLDAKLLEFTLMAKARKQIADEANTAEEVEKDAWRQEETKRVEDMVRALSKNLLNISSCMCGIHIDRFEGTFLAGRAARLSCRLAGEARIFNASGLNQWEGYCLGNLNRSIKANWPYAPTVSGTC